MPVSAVTFCGTLITSASSRMASSGSRLSDTRGYLIWCTESVMTEKAVTSLPVPLVVGMAMSPIFWDVILSANSRMALAESMAEPPPTATRQSGA